MGLSELLGFSTGDLVLSEVLAGNLLVSLLGSFFNNPDIQKSWITIEEKRLDVKKEMIKTSPDWKKIEKLNTDIATEQAKMRTAMEKYMRENPNFTYPNTR